MRSSPSTMWLAPLAIATLALTTAAHANDEPSLRCLDLPGASRDELAASDDRFLTWTQKNPETGVDDFHIWEAATGKTVRAIEDASRARLFDNVIVSLHSGGKGPKAPKVLRLGEVVVSPPGHDVLSFVVDAPRKVVYFTTSTKTAPRAVWQVALTGGTPKRLTDWGQVVGVVPDGTALIMWSHNAKSELVTFPLDGGPTVVLAQQVSTTYPVGDKVLFNPKVGPNHGPLAMTSLDGSPPVPLTGDYARSLSAIRDSRIFQTWSRKAPLTTLTRFDQGSLVPVARLAGARARTAIMLADDKYVAMLLIHDTSDDGTLDDDDETDLCFALASDTAIHQVEHRKNPKRYNGLKKKAPLLLLGGLEGSTLRFAELGGQTTLIIESDTAGPTELPMGYGQLMPLWSILKELTAIAHKDDPTQSATPPDLLVRWRKNERHAAIDYDANHDVALPSSGAYGLSIMPREVFDFALAPRHRTHSNYQWTVPHRTVCDGTIENLDQEVVDVTIECSPSKDESNAPAPGTTTVKALKPGEKRKYTIDLGASQNVILKLDVKLMVGETRRLWFNDHALAELRDFAGMADRIREKTGYALDLGRELTAIKTFDVRHTSPKLIAPGFSQKPQAEQDRIAKLVWKELAAHYRAQHDQSAFTVAIDDGSPHGRKIESGKLSKIETPK